MNITAIKLISYAFSMKQEIRIIFITFLIIALLPVLAVVTLTQAGIDAVSGVLVSQDVQLAQVDIHDPSTGLIIDHIETSIVWPVTGPISLEFAQHSPYQVFHSGIDIASPNRQVGDPVVAFMKGTVIYADEKFWGYGKHVIIDHGHHVVSIYGHLDSLNVVVGQEVVEGTILGTRGSTGWSTGPHLHFEIKVFGLPVNPRVFLTGNPQY